MTVAGEFPLITIITSTLNAGKVIGQLIDSLRAQTDRRFRWVVADGGSTDDTLAILAAAPDVVTEVIEGPDFGIYDGLNRALGRVETSYYLVMGADDILFPHAVEVFNLAAEGLPAQLISAEVVTSDGGVLRPLRGSRLRFGHLAYISQHSVGTLILKDLHKAVGMYSNRFPIAADRHFILKAIEFQNATIKPIDRTVGVYSVSGTSNRQFHNALLDIFKVDFDLSDRPLLTALYCAIRYLRFVPSMGMREAKQNNGARHTLAAKLHLPDQDLQ